MNTKIIAVVVLCSSSIFSSPAFAVATESPEAYAADANTTNAMKAQCDALAALHNAPNHTWSAAVETGLVTLTSGPTEKAPRTIDLESVVGTGAFTWGGIKIVGDPFRNGGSVNMFGHQRATEKNYPSSTYDYTAEFDSTFSHAFDCAMTETVHTDAVHIPGHKVQGFYNNPGGGDCGGFDESHNKWGQDVGACIFTKTGEAQDPVDVPASDEDFPRPSEAGVPVPQDQTDTLQGHEANGGPVTIEGDLFVGKPVVCISPKKPAPGGTWQTQNNYTGAKCTTAWFTVAPWGGGSETSNGTLRSVPAF